MNRLYLALALALAIVAAFWLHGAFAATAEPSANRQMLRAVEAQVRELEERTRGVARQHAADEVHRKFQQFHPDEHSR